MTESVKGELIYFAHTLSKKFKELLIVPTADIHYDNPLFSKHHFEKHIDFILGHPNCYTVGVGDYCEAVTKISKGDIFKQRASPQEQRDWIIEKLKPIKDRILGMVSGNHDQRIYDLTGIDICKDIAKALNVPYRPEGILLKISFGDNNSRVDGRPYTYFIYATHGYGGARTKSAKAVKVERVATWIDADCYIMSHDHVVNVAPDVYLVPDNRTHLDEESGFNVGSIQAHRKVLVKSNAFIKWGGYSERGGFPPVDLETPLIKLAGTGKPHINVEI